MTYSVLIATRDRAADLSATLESLATLRASRPWEVIVADNGSVDRTPEVIRRAASSFPAPLHCVIEPTPGRSAALNAAFARAAGDVILTTDDDVRVPPDWLEQAGHALEALQCDYVGGRVLPMWGGPRPAWLPDRPGPQWAVIALLDYGATPFEWTTRMPLGVNMAFRREALARVGGWDPRVGRRAGTLLGQEVREWCIRARAAGVHGFYAPQLQLRHVIPASRLTKRYYRRWFYWRGVSRALLYAQHGLDMENPQQTSLDFSRVPHLGGVPRYLYRTLARRLWAMSAAAARGDRLLQFEQELWLWMFMGIAHQRWRDRTRPPDVSHAHDMASPPHATRGAGSA